MSKHSSNKHVTGDTLTSCLLSKSKCHFYVPKNFNTLNSQQQKVLNMKHKMCTYIIELTISAICRVFLIQSSYVSSDQSYLIINTEIITKFTKRKTKNLTECWPVNQHRTQSYPSCVSANSFNTS